MVRRIHYVHFGRMLQWVRAYYNTIGVEFVRSHNVVRYIANINISAVNMLSTCEEVVYGMTDPTYFHLAKLLWTNKKCSASLGRK